MPVNLLISMCQMLSKNTYELRSQMVKANSGNIEQSQEVKAHYTVAESNNNKTMSLQTFKMQTGK